MGNKDECNKKTFLCDVSAHQLTVFIENGVYRHIRLSDGTIYLGYDLVTWPQHIVYTGDMGTYMFKRTYDMFEFFRNNDLKINKSYFAEKAVAESGDLIKEYSEEQFKLAIKLLSQDKSDEIKELIEYELILPTFEFENQARYAVDQFSIEHEGIFDDFWETDLKRYTRHFTWCCYAIVWGIQKFDCLKQKAVKRDAFESEMLKTQQFTTRQ